MRLVAAIFLGLVLISADAIGQDSISERQQAITGIIKAADAQARAYVDFLQVTHCKTKDDFDQSIRDDLKLIAALAKAVDRWLDSNNANVSLKYLDIKTNATNSLAQRILYVAESSLKLGCPEIADHHYRQILSIFTGDNYAAYRQRALIGIEDIRSKNVALQEGHPRITEGVEAFEVALSKTGMAGAKTQIEECWSNLRRKWNRGDAEFCFGMDFTASGREDAAAMAANYPRTEFFKLKNVFARTDKILTDLYPDPNKRRHVIAEWAGAAQVALQKLVR